MKDGKGEVPIYLDRHDTKILRTIYKAAKKHKDKAITEGELIKQFGDDGTSMFLINAAREDYLLAEDGEGSYHNFKKDDPFVTGYRFKWWPTPKLNKLFEDEQASFFKWALPTIISVIALALSIITFVCSQNSGEPILIKILR